MMRWTILWQGHRVGGILWKHLQLTQVPKRLEARKKRADAAREMHFLKAGPAGPLTHYLS